MTELIAFGFSLMFLRTELSLVNESLLYYVSNLDGAILIYIKIFKVLLQQPHSAKKHLLLYAFVNSLFIALRLLSIELTEIPLSTVRSTLLSLFMLTGHVMLFIYPLFLLSQLMQTTDAFVSSKRTDMLARVLKASILLTALSMVLFFFPAVSSLSVLLVLLFQLGLLVLLSLPAEDKGLAE